MRGVPRKYPRGIRYQADILINADHKVCICQLSPLQFSLLRSLVSFALSLLRSLDLPLQQYECLTDLTKIDFGKVYHLQVEKPNIIYFNL